MKLPDLSSMDFESSIKLKYTKKLLVLRRIMVTQMAKESLTPFYITGLFGLTILLFLAIFSTFKMNKKPY